MNEVEEIIRGYRATGTIADSDLRRISEEDSEIRTSLCQYFREHRDREFALSFLSAYIAARNVDDCETAAVDIMLASYLVGLHGEIEDCILLWRAKFTDFDVGCMFDCQLLVFGGVERTIEFLKSSNDAKAPDFLDYVLRANERGEFADLDHYFAPDNLPWWI